MNLTDLLLKRRSIRNYSKDKVDKEDINKIIEAGLLSPSSRNLKPVEMIVVDNPDLLKKLSLCKVGGSQMLEKASHAIIVMGDTDRSDVWIEDCSIVLMIMHLKATELGLGSCWVQCRNRYTEEGISSNDYITDLLSIPARFKVLGILSIGHMVSEQDYNKIHYNYYSKNLWLMGAIIGDIVGSRFERHNHKNKDFELFNARCRPTDDSIMTIAIAKALLDSNEDYSDLSEKAIYWMQTLGCAHLDAGYGGGFRRWLQADHPKPYNSYGNGAAMRISPVGWVANTLEEVKELSYKVTSVTHNHPEALKGAEATAVCIYLARDCYTMDEIKQYIEDHYYDINFSLNNIRSSYKFDVSCQGSVPQALECFFESESYEDAIRNAISIGGDSDTIAAICGGIAEAYYGIDSELIDQGVSYLDEDLISIIRDFSNKYITSED